jgi:hypothetical protein
MVPSATDFNGTPGTAVRYNGGVATAQKVPSGTVHDESLLDWFLSLDPAERLAELESRLAFFNAARRDADTELSPDSGAA